MRENDGKLRHHAGTLKAFDALGRPLGLLLEDLQLGKGLPQGGRPLVHELRHTHAVQSQARDKDPREHEPVPVLGDEALQAPGVEIGIGPRSCLAKELVDRAVVGRHAPVDAVGTRGLQSEKGLRHGARDPRIRHLCGSHGPGRIELGGSGTDLARSVLSVDHLESALMLGMAIEPLLQKTESQEGDVSRTVKQVPRRRLHRVIVAQIKRLAEEPVHLDPLLHHLAVGDEQPREGRWRRSSEHAALQVPQGLDVRTVGGRHDRRAFAVVRVGIGKRNGRDERLDAFVGKTPVKASAREKDVHITPLDRLAELRERKVRHLHAVLAEVLLERRDRCGHDLLVGRRANVLHNRQPHRSLYIDRRCRKSMGGRSQKRCINGINLVVGPSRCISRYKANRHQKNSHKDG